SDEISAAKPLEVEKIRRGSSPQPQRVHRVAAITDDGAIEGNPDQASRFAKNSLECAAAHFKRAIQLDLDLFVGTNDFPSIGAEKPFARLLVLPAFVEGLPKDAVFITQAIPHRRKLQRAH